MRKKGHFPIKGEKTDPTVAKCQALIWVIVGIAILVTFLIAL